ncbi:transposase family protein [Streptomyces sp. NPDC050161]|uniref:transposase family protein n=1 Tax=Streptomyces sp. NPDC050161 TaxID=3365604 RepID=UPI00379CC18D
MVRAAPVRTRRAASSPGCWCRGKHKLVFVDRLLASLVLIGGTEIRVRRPAAGRKGREKFISGKNKHNVVKSMVVTDADGRLLLRSPAAPASCADITHARQLGLVKLLRDGPAAAISPTPATRGWAPRPAGES